MTFLSILDSFINSLYLLIDATDSDDNVTSYRVPLSLTDSCSAQP